MECFVCCQFWFYIQIKFMGTELSDLTYTHIRVESVVLDGVCSLINLMTMQDSLLPGEPEEWIFKLFYRLHHLTQDPKILQQTHTHEAELSHINSVPGFSAVHTFGIGSRFGRSATVPYLSAWNMNCVQSKYCFSSPSLCARLLLHVRSRNLLILNFQIMITA